MCVFTTCKFDNDLIKHKDAMPGIMVACGLYILLPVSVEFLDISNDVYLFLFYGNQFGFIPI